MQKNRVMSALPLTSVAVLSLFAGAAVASSASLPAQGPQALVAPTGSGFALKVNGVVVRQAAAPIANVRAIRADARTLVATWTEGGVNAYGVSQDGGRSFHVVTNVNYDLQVRYGAFDPLTDRAGVPAGFEADPASRVRIVQFVTQPLDAYKSAIKALGGTVLTAMPSHAWVVSIDPAMEAELAALPYVRAISAVPALYRIDPDILTKHFGMANLGLPSQHEGFMDRNAPGAAEHYHVSVMQPGRAAKQRVADAIAAMGGQVDDIGEGGGVFRALLTPEQVVQVARLDDVNFIDPWGPGGTDMDIVRNLGGANYLETQAGYRGEGVRGEVFDSGIRQTHLDFVSAPIMHNASGIDSHGTATYGQVFGDGNVNPAGRGLLPQGVGIFGASGFALNAGVGARYAYTAQLVDPVGFPQYQAVFQTNSTGSNRVTTYTNISQELDRILFDTGLVILQSQSNANNQMSRPEAWAKNMISVGALNHLNNTNYGDDNWNGASIGPASDGRIKPELAFYYDNIFTTTSTSDTAYTSTFGGTSAATPMTAGFVGLMFQMWHNGIFGNPTGATVFESRPKQSTARALMINSARQWTGVFFNGNRDRARQGWGHADVRKLYDIRNNMFIVNETDALQNLQTKTYRVTVAAGAPEAKFTMVYTDPAGNPAVQTQHRVNNIDLKVTAPDGTIYWGNWGIGSRNPANILQAYAGVEGEWSIAGGQPDVRNTAENVFVQNPAAGVWTVEVIAAELVQDTLPRGVGVVPSGPIDANFALVVSGARQICTGDVNGDGIVNFVDLNLLLTNFGQSGSGLPGDLNGDGIVDFNDLNVVLSNFGTVC